MIFASEWDYAKCNHYSCFGGEHEASRFFGHNFAIPPEVDASAEGVSGFTGDLPGATQSASYDARKFSVRLLGWLFSTGCFHGPVSINRGVAPELRGTAEDARQQQRSKAKSRGPFAVGFGGARGHSIFTDFSFCRRKDSSAALKTLARSSGVESRYSTVRAWVVVG